MSLISDTELLAIQQVAQSGMISQATIWPRVVSLTDDGQSETWPAASVTVEAWLWEETPDSTAITIIGGRKGIAEVFALRLPIGTPVESGDHVVVGGDTYTVEHTNVESTYKPWLVCSVRKIE